MDILARFFLKNNRYIKHEKSRQIVQVLALVLWKHFRSLPPPNFGEKNFQVPPLNHPSPRPSRNL